MTGRTKRFWGLLISILFGVLLLPSSLWAWNDLGHVTVAQIAFRQLSPAQQVVVLEILRHHPHYDTYFQKPDGLAIDEAEWVFLRAATWCDYVRPPRDFDRNLLAAHPIHKFHRGPWHYINYPYRAGEVVNETLPEPLIAPHDEPTDIIRQLRLSTDVLRTGAADPGRVAGLTDEQNRAVRLCWLFHLIGDLHQPLHAVALVDSQLFPAPNHGDNGGNFVLIRTSPSNRYTNLHAYWDGALGYINGWRDADDVARLQQDLARCRELADFLTHGDFAPSNLAELAAHRDYADWAAESYRLAVTVAYQSGQLTFVARSTLDAGQVQPSDIPQISPAFREQTRKTAYRRAALAGYRLAECLQPLAPSE